MCSRPTGSLYLPPRRLVSLLGCFSLEQKTFSGTSVASIKRAEIVFLLVAGGGDGFQRAEVICAFSRREVMIRTQRYFLRFDEKLDLQSAQVKLG